MKIKILLLALLGAIVTNVVMAKDKDEEEKWLPLTKKVVLEGTIKTWKVFRDPWGEDEKKDPMVDAPFLILDKPVNAKGTNNPKDANSMGDFYDIKEIQISYSSSSLLTQYSKLAKSNGKRVKLTGILWGADNGSVYTEVFLELKKVNSIR